MGQTVSEDARYKLYRWGAHLAWWGALTWTGTLTWLNLTREATAPPSAFMRISGIGIILLMGIAIALGSALSRMRLARTISNVFETGMRLANDRHTEIEDQIKIAVDASEVRMRREGVKNGNHPAPTA